MATCASSSLPLLTMTSRGPSKRSMMIAGHATSISLEPIFWDALREAAEEEGLPLSALVARIDTERIEAVDPPNLASAVRVWLFERAIAKRLQ
jgi:predicted DNA-binding ribbon-helix-helix protein